MSAIRHVLVAVGICLWCPALFAQQRDQRPGAQAIAQRVTAWLNRQDANSDGRITRSEATGLMKTNFARIDENGDGVIDRAELRTLAQRAPRNGDNEQSPNRRQQMATQLLLARAPDDVVIEPDIAYREGDSQAWRLDLVRPKAESDAMRPGIVFVHGGGWRSGDKRAGTFLNGAIEYAQQGYVCITVNYRMLDEAPIDACVEDVKNAVRWFRAHADKYHLDPNRIGGFGNSAGAHLVCMLGLAGPDAGLEGDGPYQDQSSMLQAVCASAPPTDFSLFRGQPAEGGGDGRRSVLTESSEERQELARRMSPVTYVSAAAPPMLIIQGTGDRTVDVQHGDRLVEALRDAGAKDVTYLRIDGAGHSVFNQHADQTKPAMREFFARTIGAATIRNTP